MLIIRNKIVNIIIVNKNEDKKNYIQSFRVSGGRKRGSILKM